jgi:probable HAF family extracellular repeat protein
MGKKVWRAMAAVFLAVFCLTGSLGAVVYNYQDLSLQGLSIKNYPDLINAINDAGWIVGAYKDAGLNKYQPFLWRPGLGRTTLPLNAYGTGLEARAYGINNQGQIVGQATLSPGPAKACWWSSPSAIPAELLTSAASLVSGCAYGINEAGQVAGEGQFAEGGPVHAALWPANHGTATDLGTLGGDTSSGRSINNAGQVVGIADNSQGYSRAVIWNVGQTAQDLDAFLNDGSTANVINNLGNVMGQAMTYLGGGSAFFWDHQTGMAQLLTDLYTSGAGGLSDANQVAGGGETIFPHISPCPWYWTPTGGEKDLNQMVANLPNGVTIVSVSAISPKGLMTGWDSQGHPYLLMPVASLPGLGLLLSD